MKEKYASKRVLAVSAAAVSLALLTHPGPAAAGEVHWTYSGDEGPAHWGDLLDSHGDRAFPTCSDGMEQSPIDISDVEEGDLPEIDFKYKKSPLEIKNNGHTIQVNYRRGSSITVGGETYDLLQFHFHALSENTIDGEHADLEGHFVHASDDGVLAVVGFMMVEGDHNRAFQKVLDYMPSEEITVTVKGVKIDAKKLLPDDLEYYGFTGSLTTPPCSEGVKWHVLVDPIEISEEQIHQFRELAILRDHDTHDFVGNYRPVQPLNGRVVRKSDD